MRFASVLQVLYRPSKLLVLALVVWDTSHIDPVKINESEVIQADVMASNGVIHVIDAVLMPPSDEEPTKGPTAMEESDSAGRAGLAVAAAAAVAYVL